MMSKSYTGYLLVSAFIVLYVGSFLLTIKNYPLPFSYGAGTHIFEYKYTWQKYVYYPLPYIVLKLRREKSSVLWRHEEYLKMKLLGGEVISIISSDPEN